MKSTEKYKAFVDQIANRYRKAGYRVSQEPTAKARPKFLGTLVPDLIAKKDDERIIIEVKHLDSAKNKSQLGKIASLVESQPGWRLELVLYEEEQELPKRPQYPSPKSIRTAIREADAIFNQGHTAAALMLACSAFEAAAKRAISKVEDRYAYKLTSNDLVKRLVFHGFLTEGELEVAHKAILRRNQIVHGRLKRPVSEKMLNEICKFTGRLLEQREVEIA
jgi:hypothetical protein